MIKAHPFVLRPSLTFVVPEGPERSRRVQLAHGIRPALSQQLSEGLATFRLDQCVLIQGSRRIDVLLCRHDVVVTGQHDRHSCREKSGGMGSQALEPGQLVTELRTRLGISVRQVNGRNQDAVHSGLDIARLTILGLSRQRRARQNRGATSRQNCHAIPGTFAFPDCLVPQFLKRMLWKRSLFRLELLKTNDVRPGSGKPGQKVLEPLVDVVNVEGGNFHEEDLQVCRIHHTGLPAVRGEVRTSTGTDSEIINHMCGRYRLSRRKQLVEEYFGAVSDEYEWSHRYNVAPSQPVVSIR